MFNNRKKVKALHKQLQELKQENQNIQLKKKNDRIQSQQNQIEKLKLKTLIDKLVKVDYTNSKGYPSLLYGKMIDIQEDKLILKQDRLNVNLTTTRINSINEVK